MSNPRDIKQYMQKTNRGLVQRAWGNKHSIWFHYLIQQGLCHITSLGKKPCCLTPTLALKDSDGNEIGSFLGRLIMDQLNEADILGCLVTKIVLKGQIESEKFVFKEGSNRPAKIRVLIVGVGSESLNFPNGSVLELICLMDSY